MRAYLATTYMSEATDQIQVHKADDLSQIAVEMDAIIVAAGFEDRAFHVLRHGVFQPSSYCILLRYVNDISQNSVVFEDYLELAKSKFSDENIVIVDLNTDAVEKFASELDRAISKLPPEVQRIAIDVSGMTSYAACLSLKSARTHRALYKQRVIYTSADEYVPSEEEYRSLSGRNAEPEITYVPKSMAMEMSENLVLEAFSGHRSGENRACLAIFAGYEVHRSSGAIDAINPSLLLLLYGVPGDHRHSWRTDFSKRLHTKFETTRRCATEEVSTLSPQEGIDILEEYYNYLIDDFDLVIAPICSKMHAVAAYMFWERYGEVQLSFPMPIGYDVGNRPRGVGSVYYSDLYEKRTLFRGVPNLAEA